METLRQNGLRYSQSHLDKHGHEVLDDKPIAMPSGMKNPETLQEQIRRLVKYERSETDQLQAETFDEADDFDVGDDFDPTSPFEQFFDPWIQRDVTPADLQRDADHYKKLYEAAAKREIPDPVDPATQPRTATTPENAPTEGDK